MRVYGRTYNELGQPSWVEVQTAPDGTNDMVYVTALAQVLKLNYGESPFYANYGIPAKESVVQQVFPDYFVRLTQQQYSPYFASLLVTKVNSTTPTYDIIATTTKGVQINASVPVPT